jgi:hypothetical protein
MGCIKGHVVPNFPDDKATIGVARTVPGKKNEAVETRFEDICSDWLNRLGEQF